MGGTAWALAVVLLVVPAVAGDRGCSVSASTPAHSRRTAVLGSRELKSAAPRAMTLRGGAAATMGEVTAIETKKAFDLVLQEAADKLVVVDFTAQWCGPCQRIAPTIDSMAIEMRDSVLFLKIDVDENEETAGACGVECMPTFQLYKNGDKVGQVEGADEAKLRELIKEKSQ